MKHTHFKPSRLMLACLGLSAVAAICISVLPIFGTMLGAQLTGGGLSVRQCSDFRDNDGDGKVDRNDPGCTDAVDNNESDADLVSIVANGCSVTVNYSKVFQSCAHLVTANTSSITHGGNIFCANAGPVVLERSQFNQLFTSGSQVKLCDGNNYANCSNTASISGNTTCSGTAPVTECSDGKDNDNDGAIGYQ